MRKFLPILLLTISYLGLGQELKWITDFDDAKAQASQEDKLIMMRFTGSDWCANCIRIDTTLIEKPQFEEFAKDKFVFLYLDFPTKKENALSKAQTKHNQKLLEIYNPGGAFPAILILDQNGKEMGQMNVRPNTTEGYIELLEEIVN